MGFLCFFCLIKILIFFSLIYIYNVEILTKKEERKMVARVTKEASTTSGGISVPLRPMMGVKISNTTQMRNMKCTYGNARPSRYSTQYFADAPGGKKEIFVRYN